MKTGTRVLRKIEKYSPQGGLDQTSLVFLNLSSVNHPHVKEHMERVALLAEKTANVLGKDKKAAFFAGLLHDVGKIILPAELFGGRDINAEEYKTVKTHAVAGFEVLKGLHLFTSLCAGAHHKLYQNGYGLSIRDFPSNWGLDSIKKVLEISVIVSICDFVDAFTHRKTEIKDGSDAKSSGLKEMLYDKYPNDHLVVDIVLLNNNATGVV